MTMNCGSSPIVSKRWIAFGVRFIALIGLSNAGCLVARASDQPLTVVVAATPVSGQPIQKIEFLEDGKARNYDPSEPSVSPAPLQVCLSGGRTKEMERQCINVDSEVGGHPLIVLEEQKLVQISDGNWWIFVVASFPSTADKLRGASVYKIEKQKLKVILPGVTTNIDGEFDFQCNETARLCRVIRASAIRGTGESHFSRHKYKIDVYEVNTTEPNARKVQSFATAKKYPSLDEVDRVSVIRHEMQMLKSMETRPTHISGGVK